MSPVPAGQNVDNAVREAQGMPHGAHHHSHSHGVPADFVPPMAQPMPANDFDPLAAQQAAANVTGPRFINDVGNVGFALNGGQLISGAAAVGGAVLAAPVRWTGQLAKSEGIQNRALGIQAQADRWKHSKLPRYLETTTVNDVVQKANQGVENLSRRFGISTNALDHTRSMIGQVKNGGVTVLTGATKPISSALATVGEFAGKQAVIRVPAEMLAKRRGIKVENAFKGAAVHYKATEDALDDLKRLKLDPKAAGHVGQIEESLHLLTKDPHATEHVHRLNSALGQLHQTDLQRTKEGSLAIRKLATSVSGFGESVLTGAEKMKPGGLGAIARAPQAFGKMSLSQGGLAVGMTAMTVTEFAKTFKGASQHLHELRKLTNEMEGKSGLASISHVFSSNVSNVIKEERGRLLKQFGPTLLLDAGGGVINAKAMTARGLGIPMMIGSMVTPFLGVVSQKLLPQSPLLPLLHGMEAAQKTGQHLGADSYAALLCAGSSKIGKLSTENGLVAALAQQFETAQVPPLEVIKQIESGAIDRQAAVIEKHLAATGRKAGATITPPKPALPVGVPMQPVAAPQAAAVPVPPAAHQIAAAPAPAANGNSLPVAANQNRPPLPHITSGELQGRVAANNNQQLSAAI